MHSGRQKGGRAERQKGGRAEGKFNYELRLSLNMKGLKLNGQRWRGKMAEKQKGKE